MLNPSRRDVLRTLSLGAGATALAGAGLGRARAAEQLPRRVCFFYVPNGVPETATGRDDIGILGATPTDFKLGFMTEPLEPVRSDVVIVENLSMFAQTNDTHIGGYAQGLTGAKLTPRGTATHASIDNYLAQKVGRTATPKWPLLNIAVQSQGSSWNQDGSRVAANIDPYDVYTKMFADLTTGGGPAQPDKAALDRLARRKSVLDAATKNLAEFRRRLPKEDRERAEAQLTSLRTLEERLSAGMGGAKTAMCTKPATKQGINPRDTTRTHEIMQLQTDIIANAFACDLTRIVNFSFRDSLAQSYKCPFPPFNSGEDFHGLSHNNPKDNFLLFRTGKKWLFSFVADIAKRLKAMPEGTGSMLDNTLIVVWTEIQKGHNNGGLQWVTVGGKNLGVNTGRYHLLTGKRGGLPTDHPSHTRFLVSVLHAMGVPDATFGDDATTGTGPLPGYLR